jgi:uncharacterized protein (TIGR02996 family)
MTDRDALLRAIAANPDDDTPRLMYADLLDELGGDASPARARFIRVQIDLVRNPGRSWFANSERLCEAARLAGLFADRWLDELPKWAADEARKQRLRADDFPRGFLDTFSVRPATFRAHGHQLLEVSPVTRLVIPGPLPLRDLSTLLLSGPLRAHFCRVRSLSFGAVSSGADGAAMCVRGSRILGAIEELTLEGSGLTDVGARSLSEAVDLANLRVLMVRSSRLTEAGAVALLTAPRLPRLGGARHSRRPRRLSVGSRAAAAVPAENRHRLTGRGGPHLAGPAVPRRGACDRLTFTPARA